MRISPLGQQTPQLSTWVGALHAFRCCLQVRYLFSEDISSGKEPIPVSSIDSIHGHGSVL